MAGSVPKPLPSQVCEEVALATNLFRVAANLEEALIAGKQVYAEVAGGSGEEPKPKEVRPDNFLSFGGYLVRLSDEVLGVVRTTQSNLGSVCNPKE